MSSPVLSDGDIAHICSRDVQSAEEMFAAGGSLAWWAWSVLVGEWTGVLSCRIVGNTDGKPVGVASGGSWGLNNVWHRGIQWRTPMSLAKRDSVWDVASLGKMSGWCLLLGDDDERKFACEMNAFGRVRSSRECTEPDEDLIELEQQRIRVRRLLNNNGIGLRLIGDDRS